MSIVFGGDTGIRENAFSGFVRGITGQFTDFANDIKGIANNLLGTDFPIHLPKENVYVDDGFQNVPGTAFTGSGNISSIDDTQKRRITTQAPDATVYVKKRVFWSLRNEHDSKFMGSAEKLFMRASKLLFERKCSQIAAYEAMTKLEKFTAEEVEFDVARIDALILAVEEFKNNRDILEQQLLNDVNIAATGLTAVDYSSLSRLSETYLGEMGKLDTSIKNADETIDALRELQSEARVGRNAVHTTWVVDTRKNTNRENTGRGTGVIELTLVDSLQTSLSLNSGDKGSFSFTVQDPYNLLSIRKEDIELAIGSASAEIDQSEFGIGISAGPQQLLQEARNAEAEFKKERNARFGLLDSNSSPLSGADNAEVIFEVNPSSLATNKVVGRVSSLAEPFTRNTYNLIFIQLPLEQQLTFTEQRLIKKVFDLLHEYVDAVNRISIGNPPDTNDTKYARRQMRMHYLGKPIVQPMDGIHIYIRGNTFRDNEVIGPLSALLNSASFIKGFSGRTTDGLNDAMLKEEMEQFGISKSITIDLYRSIRSSSLLRNAGMHVFGGLVSTANESYNASRGTYTLSVSGESNMKWLDLSRVNVTPSLDQAQGVLEDPLTPLDIEIDKATGLIKGSPLSDENKKRINSGCLFYKDGVRAGEQVTDDNSKQEIKEFSNTAEIVRQHSPGLIYKWKKNIVAATRNVNLRTSLSGSGSRANTLRRDVGVTVLKDSFANLDVADVISLLVTGQPHNYESFLQNTSSIGTYTSGNGNNPESFFNSVSDISRSANRALGSFEPMKFINIDREQMAKRLEKQTEFRTDNKRLVRLQSEIASITDDINLLKSGKNTSIENKGIDRLDKLTIELGEMIDSFQQSIDGAKDLGLRVYGNDILFNPDSDSGELKEKNDAIKMRTRFLQMRPQVSTKLNTDSNLFIVSDDYDKDLDLQAFAIELASGEIPIWNSTYKNPKDICVNAANVVDMEFFCDSQGHLRLQPPKYNKLPLSLLAKMLLLSDKGDRTIDIMPPFVRSLFQSREEGLKETSKILNNEIKILSWLLFGKESPPGIDLKNQGNAAQLFGENLIERRTETQEKLQVRLSDRTSRAENILKLRNEIAASRGTASVSDAPEEINKIENEITELNDPNTTNVNSKRLAKINKMLQFAGQKQRADETIKKISERQNELQTTLGNPKTGFGSPLTSGQLSSFLEPFGDLIEDDFNDFLGPGSSSRFIIRDDQVINYDFKESDNNVYCRADVTGQVDLLGEGPGSIGGIPMIWAGATDFDLWKQYGYRPAPSTNKPFFKDAETQCAPYAMMLLTRQRRDTVRASMTLVGNEFYQLGDVVYINSRDMLYYVTSISHSFSYSGSFTTKLDLRYGHPLGEFIPTPLDVIGKNIIKNERKFNTTFINRNTVVPSFGRHAGVISFIGDNVKEPEDNKREMLAGDIGASNLSELKNALLRIKAHIDKASFDKVEVRGFVKKVESRDVDEDKELIRNRMKAVRDWLVRPLSGYSDSGSEIPIDIAAFRGVPENKIGKIDDAADPIVLEVDENTGRLKEEDIGRTPSEETYNVLIDPGSMLQNVVEIVLVFKE